MNDTTNQNPTLEKINQKKQWVIPNVEIIKNGYIGTGTNPAGIEANYEPGGTADSAPELIPVYHS